MGTSKKQKKRDGLRYREFVLSPYGVIKIKSLGYTAMTYGIIALDLDGTLLDKQKKILPESLAALAHARQQGVKVVIATGRHHSAIHPFYQALDPDTPAICCNGTYLYDYQHKQTSQANPLTAAQA